MISLRSIKIRIVNVEVSADFGEDWAGVEFGEDSCGEGE
jgi:hypothetical protein